MVVSGSVGRDELDGGLKLANGAFQVARVEKPCARICGERCRLQARFTLGDFLGRKRFCLGPGRVSLLAQYGSEGSVRTRKIGLQTDRFPQRGWRFWEPTLLLKNCAQGVISLCVVRFCMDRCAKLVRRLRELALLPQGHAQGVM